MSTRPRPRPTARPRAPSATAVDATSELPSNPSAVIHVADDDDALFLKNRNRSIQTWKKLDKLAEAKDAKKERTGVDAASDEDDSDADEAPHRRKYRKADKQDVMPAWTKSVKQIVLLSDDEDEDDDVEVIDNSTPTRPDAGDAFLRKRQRSRSRSLTPPPTLPYHTLQHVRDKVRRMLGVTPRAASPTFAGDESLDNVELDPELAMIANKVKVNAQRQTSLHPRSRSPTPADIGGGPEVVQLKVRWRKHPLNPESTEAVWGFQMKRHDSFRILFDEIADIAGVLVQDIFVTYQGKRIFASASPHGIGVWAQAELDACDRVTFEYLKTHPHRSQGPVDALGADPASRGSSPITAEVNSTNPSDAENESEGGGETLKITLRSAVTKPLTLTVRQTTKCRAIVQAFLKHHKLTEKYSSSPTKGKKGKAQPAGPVLCVDGDKLSPEDEISVADLDDGDVVDVVGL